MRSCFILIAGDQRTTVMDYANSNTNLWCCSLKQNKFVL